MKVSIIIPFYNVEDYIERSLNSALNQSYDDIEIILVNDCSTDHSLEKVEKIVASSRRLSYVKLVQHAQNRGVAAARNSGVDNSTGDYIYFLDSDDEIPVSAIADLVAAAGEGKPDIVIGNYEVIGGNKSDYISIKANCRDIEGKGAVLSSFLSKQWNDGTANKLESRQMIVNNRIRFYEGIVHEDILWSFEISLHVWTFAFRKAKGHIRTPPIFLQCFAFPSEYRNTIGSNSCCCMVLSGKYVATCPTDICTQCN